MTYLEAMASPEHIKSLEDYIAREGSKMKPWLRAWAESDLATMREAVARREAKTKLRIHAIMGGEL